MKTTLRHPIIIGGRLVLLVLLTSWTFGCSTTPDRPDSVDEITEPVAESEGQIEPEVDSGPEQEMPLPVEESTEATTEFTSDVAPQVNARIQAALDQAADGRNDTAVQILTELVNEPDGGFLACYNLAVLYEHQGQYEQATRYYVQSLQRYPDFSPALRNLVRLYVRQGQIGHADEIARRYADVRPDNLDHLTVRLEVQLAQGRHEDVIRNARDILRRDERHVDAMLAMAWANYELERFELAGAILTSALDVTPSRAEIFYLFGLIDLEWERTQRAIANFRKAIDLQPHYPEARNNLGLLYTDARDYEAAIEEFEAALVANPDFKEAYLNLGNACKAAGQFRKAEESFQKAIGIDDGYADAYFNLGILYLESEVPGIETIPRLEKAIEAFHRYQRAARGRLSKDDPANSYIEEATKAIEMTRQREEMMRRSQMEAESRKNDGAADGDDSADADPEAVDDEHDDEEHAE